jgi:hypothetical protein
MNLRIRIVTCSLGLCLAVLPAGCLRDRLAWAPDGTRASVITADGLYVADAGGGLSPLLVPGAYRAAWLADSRRIAIAETRELESLRELEAVLGPERSRRLALRAEAFLQRWESAPPGAEPPAFRPESEAVAVAVYLRERDGERLRRQAGALWKDIAAMKVEWHTLSVGRVTELGVAEVAAIHGGLAEVLAIRPSPVGGVIAFVAREDLSPEGDDTLRVYVASDKGSAAPLSVVAGTSASADWTADGRTLLAFTGLGRFGGKDEFRLGTLAAFDVVDAAGHLVAGVKGRDLAAVAFHDASRVRCLRDGRVIFNALALRLPSPADDEEQAESLFVVDPASGRVAPFLKAEDAPALPKALSHFEPSPDGRQLLVGAEDGKVWLVTPAEGRVEEVCGGFGKEDSVAPAWRAAGELTYRRPGEGRHDLVHRRGKDETVLSRTWTADVLERLVK